MRELLVRGELFVTLRVRTHLFVRNKGGERGKGLVSHAEQRPGGEKTFLPCTEGHGQGGKRAQPHHAGGTAFSLRRGKDVG